MAKLKKVRNKKKLSSKQANRISLIMGAICFIGVFITWLILRPVDVQTSVILAACAIYIPLCAYPIFYHFIFKVPYRKLAEKIRNVEFRIRQSLSYENFKQVYFMPSNSSDYEIYLPMQILQNEGCKFYAKLTEDNNIHLIVKDKHNDEVYNEEIGDYSDFSLNFKFGK